MVPGHRYANVDALRGVAALLVLVLHASELFAPMPGLAGRGRAWHDATAAIDLGRVGVVAFFLISGFVIPATLDGPRWTALRRFWIRRLFRLYPAFWLSIPLGFWALWSLQDRAYSAADVVANATMLPALFGREATIGLYWTLETELAFYALCSVLFAAGGLRRPGVLIATQCALLGVLLAMRLEPALRPALPQWLLMPHSLAVMIAGAMCRRAFDARERQGAAHPAFRREATLAGASLALALGPAVVYALTDPGARGSTFAASYAIGFALFVATIAWVRRPPAALVGLGTVSYSLYLMHPVALYAIGHVVRPLAVPAPFGVGTMMLVVAIAAIALAAASYRLVELPAIRLGRRWTARPRTDAGAAPVGQVER